MNDGLIYLATAYSHPDRDVMEARFVQACQIAGRLMRAGHLVFSPIAHTHPIAIQCDLPRDWEFWQRYDLALLSACSPLLVVTMDGWRESRGIAGEIEIARTLGLPVRYLAPDAGFGDATENAP